MWIYVPGETRESVFERLSARKRGAAVGSVIQLERNPADAAAKSLESFFARVSSHFMNSRDAFDDNIFLMKDVGIGVLDENDRPVGDGTPWDLYARLGEDRFTVHYWAVHAASGNHVAWASIPKMSRFVHFSTCGHKFVTMNIYDKGTTPEEDLGGCNVITQ
eukprot:CAMPEP_0172547402 /NCGR_PEP_ID=MMETSP1067-20121228/16950_1 /TAXON_ID=265564 ORGANISM="Thalassiosira punctigera, Strain Tpunct2005C2" /NCGR_SAMPLE_ID=MMETSP1067 /ASSEMBLY_ACC=CAM_ASM_000444 /LENGTH=161 /DNA_ID=CAMNT_0013334487 /DNA_START=75 /DNA_END=560 /DNA_ORIENTATION=+